MPALRPNASLSGTGASRAEASLTGSASLRAEASLSTPSANNVVTYFGAPVTHLGEEVTSSA